MLIFNIILVFITPWFVALLHLHKKDPQIIPTIGPFFSVLAFTINEFGFYFDYWNVAPFLEQETISALPFNLGLYPILASYLVFYTKNSNQPILVIFMMSLFVTLLESTYLALGHVKYGNGWNVYYTFGSYLLPFASTYLFYEFLKKRVS